MLQEVTEFLGATATPEYTQIATESLKVFERYDYAEHEQDLLNAVLGNTDDEASAVQNVHFILLHHLDKILAMHNITIGDEAPLGLINQILDGILNMQFWDDKAALLTLIEGAQTPEEGFAALLQEVVGLPPGPVLDVLEEFDEAYLKRLNQILSGDMPEPLTEDDELDTEQLVRLKNYHLFIGNNKLIGIRLIKLGYKIGAPFERYVNKVKERLLSLDDEQFTQEIMVLFLMGRDTWTAPTQAWRDFNHLFDLDLVNVTAVDAKLKQLWGQFDRFSTQSINGA